MRTIDHYSLTSVPIDLFFDDRALSTATAFFWKHKGQVYLITNWHNVSGRNAETKKCISPTGAEPNMIGPYLNSARDIPDKRQVKFELLDRDSRPLWYVHPTYGHLVDAVALLVDMPPWAAPFCINEAPTTPLRVSVGQDVFVLGFPLGLGYSGLPIWKRGSIASEPQIIDVERPLIYIDTASRPGMSGSPVIVRSEGGALQANQSMVWNGEPQSIFLGIYSGRLGGTDTMDAQLGMIWPARLIREIVAGKKRDVSPH